MRRSLVVAGVVLAAALAGCSDEPDDREPQASGGDPCASVGPTVSVECAPSDAPTAPPKESIPADSTAYPPLTLPSENGQLAAGGNDRDPSLRKAQWRVEVPAGARLRIRATCEGVGIIKITTQPVSNAEMEFACGFQGEPVGLAVEDDTKADAPRAVTVSVEAPTPARWWVSVGSTTQELPEAEG